MVLNHVVWTVVTECATMKVSVIVSLRVVLYCPLVFMLINYPVCSDDGGDDGELQFSSYCQCCWMVSVQDLFFWCCI